MINKRVLKAAFTVSLPVLMGYMAMGMAAGILLAKTTDIGGVSFWAFVTSSINISGALQFLIADWAKNMTPMTQVILLTLCLNLRYALYGFSLLERFKKASLPVRLYLIWALTDETYAIQVANKVPEGEDSISYCLAVAAFDHLYWVAGVVTGAVIGSSLPFDCRGIDFAMTALFLVILTDQCRAKYNRLPALIGAGAALISRGFLDTGNMLLCAIPLMVCVLILLQYAAGKEKADA